MLRHALHPHVIRGIHHQNQMEIAALACFHEQWDVLDHDGANGGGGDHRAARSRTSGWTMPLSAASLSGSSEHHRPKLGPVQPAAGVQHFLSERFHHLREAGGARFHHFPGEGVGIDQDGPQLPQT